MSIEDLTLKQLTKILELNTESTNLPFKVGESYLFRTVTHIDVGRVKRIVGQFVELDEASWIADTGRWHDCLVNGVFNEIEPYPLYTGVNAQSIIDYAPWPHDLPKEQK